MGYIFGIDERWVNMLVYDSYKLQKKANYIKVMADVSVEYVFSDNEVYVIGTPSCWDECILKRINISQYNMFHLCITTVHNGKYNRITDYKKIWGLNHLPIGEYENSYITEKGKVYYGSIHSSPQESFYADYSSLIILVPTIQFFDPNIVFQYLFVHNFDFVTMVDDKICDEIQKLVPGSIVLCFCSDDEISLSVFGAQMEDLFVMDDVKSWGRENTFPVFRRSIRKYNQE